MYRVLAERAPVRERRKQREAKSHAIPRLVAAAPNQAWSWKLSAQPFEIERALARQAAQVFALLCPRDAFVQHRQRNDQRRQSDARGRPSVQFVVELGTQWSISG